MKKALFMILALFTLPAASMEAAAPGDWQAEVISLISHQRFKEAGDKVKTQCVEKKNAELCLIMASAYYEGEAKFGINTKDIIEAYKYTKLACEHGSDEGCGASKAAIEKGELIQNVLFEPGIENRGAQLKEAIKLGADLNSTTIFTTTLLQQAIGEEKTQVIKLMIENGVDVNYRVSDEDLTPLMYAINSGNKEIVTLLLDNGADPAKTMKVADYLKMGKKEANACDFADKLKQQEIMAQLKCNNAPAKAK